MRTIFALSSGRPPAAIAVMRVSGPGAADAGVALAGHLPPPRTASVRTLRDGTGSVLDRAMMLWFPGPATATGEDVVEFHVHGGRAVVAAVDRALAILPGIRRAMPGEFTRRALEHGRIDLVQAQGLADLLEAETERQRRAAIASAEGLLSRRIGRWMKQLASIAATIEASIDFDDEDDVPPFDDDHIRGDIGALLGELRATLARPTVERIREGVRVVLSGAPNAGKSSLFNALLERDAAIVSPIAGTTRDAIEATVVRDGKTYTLVDTAGIRATTDDPIERLGITRSYRARAIADIILWLDDEYPDDPRALWVLARCDERPAQCPSRDERIATTIHDTATIDALWTAITDQARASLDSEDDISLATTQHEIVSQVTISLARALEQGELILRAEDVRVAATTLAHLLGIDATEAMLDTLFARFCVGK